MNFSFFMLMIGPSQAGKTTWIKTFIKSFTYLNPGHTLESILYLHMSKDDKLWEDLDDDLLHKIKINLTNNEMIDKEITQIEIFKSKKK